MILYYNIIIYILNKIIYITITIPNSHFLPIYSFTRVCVTTLKGIKKGRLSSLVIFLSCAFFLF